MNRRQLLNVQPLCGSRRQLIVTIDGPAGAGKSTTAKALAARLGYTYLDSGALYRAVAWKMALRGIDPIDEREVRDLLATTTIRLSKTNDHLSVMVDAQDVTDNLRAPDVGRLASVVATNPLIREWLLPLQQEWGRRGGLVAEGRDMGTRVFPLADVKFFLDADVEIRAQRRLKDETQGAGSQSLDAVRADLVERDVRDSSRDIAPLYPASDAIMIDTSTRSLEQVVEEMVAAIAARQ
ncbi:MAG: (d)CMP kinase [Nitrospirae bacterium]|nr:MAG: (d)CMP kinase [Nitrospirota bacterium]